MPKKEVFIRKSSGSAIDYNQGHLINLISTGYGFSGDRETLVIQVQREYGNADFVYFAVQDRIEQGSLSMGLRLNREYDPFWKTLGLLGRSFRQDAIACYIYGIVVHPSARREGVGSKLFTAVVGEFNPDIVFGQTNRPEVVSLRAKAFKEYGYRTFYGFCEVTPNFGFETEHEGRDFIYASFAAEGVEISPSGIYCVGEELLSSYFPKTDGFPQEIQRAFKPVQETQLSLGRQNTAVSALVSVKSPLLESIGSVPLMS